MSTEQKATEQNALAEPLGSFWGNFKQGKIIGYKWMASLLILGTAIGVTWYILSERKAAASKHWVEMDEASTSDAAERSLDEESRTRFKTSSPACNAHAACWAIPASIC